MNSTSPSAMLRKPFGTRVCFRFKRIAITTKKTTATQLLMMAFVTESPPRWKTVSAAAGGIENCIIYFLFNASYSFPYFFAFLTTIHAVDNRAIERENTRNFGAV